MNFVLIENGEVLDPNPRGEQSVLVAGERIARSGQIRRKALDSLELAYEVIDASGCYVIPGLVDPHEHLIGGSGEQGFASQTPEIALQELVRGGITTVAGCLGTDVHTKNMPALLAKAKAINAQGLTSYIWSGGYTIPPATLTGSVRTDVLFVAEVIGAGEVAIADRRSSAPALDELARIVRDTYVAGTLTFKAGVTHFHVGEEGSGMEHLRGLLNDHGISTESLYPTHVERTGALMKEAVELTRRGVTVDVDTVERDLPRSLRCFLEQGGDPERFTASSDAAINSPETLWQQVRSCVLDHGLEFQTVLPVVTSNTARVLKLSAKGCLAANADADLLVVRRDSLEIVEVIGRGKRLLKEGAVAIAPPWVTESNRRIELYGQKP